MTLYSCFIIIMHINGILHVLFDTSFENSIVFQWCNIILRKKYSLNQTKKKYGHYAIDIP